ncbi:RNA ligase family protein [Paenibacillus sp. FSL H7-0326]
MLLVDQKEAYESKDSIVELKLDGIRTILSVNDKTRIFTRHNNEITSNFEEVTTAAARAAKAPMVLDGELIVSDLSTGKPDFSAMMSRFSSRSRSKIPTPGLTFVAFDILSYDGKDLRGLPLMKRKEILEEVLSENEIIKKIRYMESGFVPLYELCKQEQLEGIVIKKKDAVYHSGKRPKSVWERVVVYQRERCIVTGFSKKEKSWYIGIRRGDHIESVGAVKYGLNTSKAKALYPKLLKSVIKENQAYAIVKPEHEILVRFRHYTKDGKMRLAVVEDVYNK